MNASRFSTTRRHFIVGAAGLGFVFSLSGVARADDATITDADAYARQQAGQMIIVDVRRPDEWQQTGVAKGALTADMTDPAFIQKMVDLRKANPDKQIGLMCRTSHRSGLAQQSLAQAGFDKIYSIVGGIAGNDQAPGWIADGLPVEPWSGK